jgi:V/A-type H+-transporting ATPase subunit K
MNAKRRLLSVLVATGVLLFAGSFALLAMIGTAIAQPEPAVAAAAATVDPEALQWAMLSAALAVAFSSLAAGYAVARVASAGVGAVTEKPELMGRVLVFVGLAEGIAIYGLIIAILILNRVS